MNVLVTGATGFLGGHLTHALEARGGNVVGLVHDGHRGLDRDLGHWVFGDVLDGALLRRTLAEYEIDVVFHLAAQAQVSVAVAEPVGTFRANIEGTWNVLEACRLEKVARVVVASTDKVYGDAKQAYSEQLPLDGRAPYDVSKVCADVLAQSYAKTYGMSIAITRCSNLYGPGHVNYSALIPGTIRRILSGERPVVKGDGSSERHFLFVEDAAEAYLALAASDYVGAMNFSGDRPRTIRETVEAIAALMRYDGTVDYQPVARYEIVKQRMDSSLARRVLGWTAKTPFDEGLVRTVEWHRKGCR